MPEETLCVLIDFENIAAGSEKEGLGRFDIRRVMNRLKEKGRILVSRAYGDWGRFAKYKQQLLIEGISMRELTSYRGQDKNRADIALVVDAMELMFTRDHISTYVLLSGDSDFTPLVMRLREFNKKVIGIGNKSSTSRLLAESCDEFIFYESIRRQSSYQRSVGTEDHGEDVVKKSLSLQEAFGLLIESLEGIQKDTAGPVAAGPIKQSMQRKRPTFDETDYGFTGFTRFLKAAAQRQLVQLVANQRGGGFLVDLLADTDAEQTIEPDKTLPELTGTAQELYGQLANLGFPPASNIIRHTVVHEFYDHVQERRARKRKNTLFYVYGDIERRCRKTTPIVESGHVRSVINALHAAGELCHPNGGAVRNQKAAFILNKDADELLKSLRNFYVDLLLKENSSLSDGMALSELLWNDNDHQEESERLLAWGKHLRMEEQPLTSKTEAQSTKQDNQQDEEDDDSLEDLGLVWETSDDKSKNTQSKTSKDSQIAAETNTQKENVSTDELPQNKTQEEPPETSPVENQSTKQDEQEKPKTEASKPKSRKRKSTKTTTRKTTKKAPSRKKKTEDKTSEDKTLEDKTLEDKASEDKASKDAVEPAKKTTRKRTTRKKASPQSLSKAEKTDQDSVEKPKVVRRRPKKTENDDQS